MFYVYLNDNRVAVKIATCFFTEGNIELIKYNQPNK